MTGVFAGQTDSNNCDDRDHLLLAEPALEYADEIWRFRQEVLEHDGDSGDKFAGCFAMESCASPEEWIRICTLLKDPLTCNDAGSSVSSHQYLLVRVDDNRVVGIFDLRDHIDHPVLSVWGGHCGYTVRPSERGKGYSKKMLRLGIAKAKELGIPKLLVTCDKSNTASRKAILSNGGIFESIIEIDGNPIERYWITVE